MPFCFLTLSLTIPIYGLIHVKHWSQTQFLEGHSSAQFSSNQLQLTPVWKFLVILKSLSGWIRCVWIGLELNCAELWPSRNWVWDQWCKGTIRRALWKIKVENNAYIGCSKIWSYSEQLQFKLIGTLNQNICSIYWLKTIIKTTTKHKNTKPWEIGTDTPPVITEHRV